MEVREEKEDREDQEVGGERRAEEHQRGVLSLFLLKVVKRG